MKEEIKYFIDNISDIKLLQEELIKYFNNISDIFRDLDFIIIELKVGYLEYKVVEKSGFYKIFTYKNLKIQRLNKIKSLDL